MKPRLFFASLFAVCAAAAALSLAGCGSSRSGGATPGDGGTAGDDGGVDASDDAPDYHDVYPAPHPPIPAMHNFGGRVIKTPEIVTVTFAGMDPTVRDYLRDFDDKISQSDWWKTIMAGFGVNTGSGAGYAELPDVFSGAQTTDQQVESYIATQIAAGKLPYPNDSTIYMLYVPYSAVVLLGANDQSCVTFGGFHGSGLVSIDGGQQEFLYAILDDCRGPSGTPQQIMDDQTYVASHELAEIATDPDINTSANGGWYLPGGNDAWVTNRAGGEVGDLCAGQSWQQGNWLVTKSWNAASAAASGSPCLPSPTPWYFNAAIVTENPRKAQGVGPDADGYIVVKKGDTRTVEVDVFSTQPLPNDLTLLAGHFPSPVPGQTYDPYKVVPIYSTVTSSFSQPKARNGDRVQLTITVPASLHTLTTRFYVRAVLSATDYHSWPAILYVP